MSFTTTTTTTTQTQTQRPKTITFATPGESLRNATLRKNMSITQTYHLAHRARGKLAREAAQPDHDLRLLVGHANLLDNLMLELADAEREQERWFNQSVRGASQRQSPPPQKDRHIQWADSVDAVREEDEYSDSDSDTSEDSDISEDIADVSFINIFSTPKSTNSTTTSAPVIRVVTTELEEDMEEDDLEEDYAQLELVRTSSHSNQPPELDDHTESDISDDESMPPSPNNTVLSLPEKDQVDTETDLLYSDSQFYLPSTRETPAISVY